jgi:putative flippase GtrA
LAAQRALTLRYTAVSLMATTLDFLVFGLLGYVGMLANSAATLVSSTCGGLLAWVLYRRWVFADSTVRKWRVRSRYALGVVLGIGLNSALVGFFSDWFDIQRMWGRVLAATSTWGILYFFNRKIVFKI